LVFQKILWWQRKKRRKGIIISFADLAKAENIKSFAKATE